MYKRRSQTSGVSIEFEGKPVQCSTGDTVAGAILAADPEYTRLTPKRGARRSPYCMMGVCFECLMDIDGVANQQACLTIVSDGMRVKRQTMVIGSDWA